MKMLDNALLKKLPAAPKTPGKPFVPTEGPACDTYKPTMKGDAFKPTMKGDAFESSAAKKIASPDGGPKDAGAKDAGAKFKGALDTAPDAGDKFKDGGDKFKDVGDKLKHFITKLKAATEAPSAE